jgi:dTDP-4-dehydrorhamnose reductase
MLRLARERDELRVVNDQRGAPTPARLIASSTALALARNLDSGNALLGTYHLTAAGECSWYEFANALLQRAAAAGIIERVPQVVPVATSGYPTRARRPAYSVLDTALFRSAFGLNLPSWQSGLDDVIGELSAAG